MPGKASPGSAPVQLLHLAVPDGGQRGQPRAGAQIAVPGGSRDRGGRTAVARASPSRPVPAGREQRTAPGRALAELPPPLRTALVLRDVEGLSTQEAAEIAGISQAAFKSRLHQARLRVRVADGDQALVTAGG